MSLSRFLNICRPFSAEWTSIILTLPAQIWEGEEERDKDESVTRERKKRQSRKTERERETHLQSPSSNLTPRVDSHCLGREESRREREGGGGMGDSRKCQGWRGVCTLEASPHPLFTSIHNSTGSKPPPAAQSPRARHRRKDTTRRGGRDKDTPLQPPKTPHTPQTVGQKMPGVNSEMHYSSLTIS